MFRTTILSLALASTIRAHTAAWGAGMYCRGGNSTTVDEPNTRTVVDPLNDLPKEQWWFQADRGCPAVPPPAGEFLSLPANGEFTIELAHNRAMTTLSYNGTHASDWPDGKDHPENWDAGEGKCLEDGALHTQNQQFQSATAWAISYESEIKDVTMENLVVFSTLDHTPWKRLATYKVPDLKECPESGCTCAWLWIPNGCGQLNMYMQGFKCKVTNASPTALPLAKAQVPVYCADDHTKCVKGAKQMLAWHQATGNNIETEGHTAPNYNSKCGYAEGAQTDIFDTTLGHGPGPVSPVPENSSSTSRAVATSTVMPIELPVTLTTLVRSSMPVSMSVIVDNFSTPAASVSSTSSTAAPTQTKVHRPWGHHGWHPWQPQYPKNTE